MNLLEKLTAIQQELKAPKSGYNSFGKYNYRTCENILTAVKPSLDKHKAALKIDNDLEVFNDKIFRKSTVTLFDTESVETITTHTYTQESIERKGMSPEQCSGSTSSYGDKYCLGKMFLIDDTQDADTQDNSNRPQQKPYQPQVNTGKPGDFQLKIGKNKGKFISNIDDMELLNFLTWIIGQDDVKGELLNTKIAIDAYLKSKGAIK